MQRPIVDFKKIIAFGDSWVYGDELLQPGLSKHYSHSANDAYRQSRGFVGLMAKELGVSFENHGVSGASLESTQWKFLQWLTREPNLTDCLVIVGLTESDRFSYVNAHPQNHEKEMVHSTWIEAEDHIVGPDFKRMIKLQTVMSQCNESNKLRYQEAVHFFDGVAQRNQIKLMQFHISAPPCYVKNIPTLVDPEFSLTYWFVHELQPIHDRKYIFDNGHPNEQGHELVKDRLIFMLKSCKLV